MARQGANGARVGDAAHAVAAGITRLLARAVQGRATCGVVPVRHWRRGRRLGRAEHVVATALLRIEVRAWAVRARVAVAARLAVLGGSLPQLASRAAAGWVQTREAGQAHAHEVQGVGAGVGVCARVTAALLRRVGQCFTPRNVRCGIARPASHSALAAPVVVVAVQRVGRRVVPVERPERPHAVRALSARRGIALGVIHDRNGANRLLSAIQADPCFVVAIGVARHVGAIAEARRTGLSIGVHATPIVVSGAITASQQYFRTLRLWVYNTTGGQLHAAHLIWPFNPSMMCCPGVGHSITKLGFPTLCWSSVSTRYSGGPHTM